VKVLDFGLAEASDPASGSGLQASELSQSPTITSPAMTMGGVILGTAAYMSPEQAKGKTVSDTSGRQEAYVTKFPERPELIPVSNSGGSEPVWARNGKELFYRNGSQMMVVSFTDGVKPILGQPQRLFESNHRPDPSVSNAIPNYDVGPDGRFLVVEGPPETEGMDLSVVVNWTEELKRLAPAR
jgi:serine/threonine protein kinase